MLALDKPAVYETADVTAGDNGPFDHVPRSRAYQPVMPKQDPAESFPQQLALDLQGPKPVAQVTPANNVHAFVDSATRLVRLQAVEAHRRTRLRIALRS